MTQKWFTIPCLQHKPAPLVTRDMIAGVRERVDSFGQVLRPLDEDDVRRKLRILVDGGARAIAVSLLWSFVNPAHEKRIREIIRDAYGVATSEIFLYALPFAVIAAVVVFFIKQVPLKTQTGAERLAEETTAPVAPPLH